MKTIKKIMHEEEHNTISPQYPKKIGWWKKIYSRSKTVLVIPFQMYLMFSSFLFIIRKQF